MSFSLNKVQLIGHLGKDPEVRRKTDGSPIVNLSVATSESWRDKQSGERQERTEWHRVVIFNEGLAKVAEQYLRKGSKVFLEGMIKTRKWQDKDGADRYSTEIVLQAFNGMMGMLDRAERDDSDRREDRRQQSQAPSSFSRDDFDDEIPF